MKKAVLIGSLGFVAGSATTLMVLAKILPPTMRKFATAFFTEVSSNLTPEEIDTLTPILKKMLVVANANRHLADVSYLEKMYNKE